MKFYIPMRCPGCGEIQFSRILHPFEDHVEEESWQGCKWIKCDVCGERLVLPRNAIIKE